MSKDSKVSKDFVKGFCPTSGFGPGLDSKPSTHIFEFSISNPFLLLTRSLIKKIFIFQMSTSSNNYSLHRYRIAYHSLNNPTNFTNNYFAGIYLHFQFLERKWRSLLLVSILSILFIFFYLTFSTFNNTEFVSSNLTFIGWFF